MSKQEQIYKDGDVVYYGNVEATIESNVFYPSRRVWICTLGFAFTDNQITCREDELKTSCSNPKSPIFKKGDYVLYDTDKMRVVDVFYAYYRDEFGYKIVDKDNVEWIVKEQSLKVYIG